MIQKQFVSIVVAAGLWGGSLSAAPAAVATTPTVPDAVEPASVQVEVDLSERKLRVVANGEVLRTFDVGVGTAEHPTPSGTFDIARIVWNPDWIPPNVAWAKDETPKEPGDPENPMRGAKIFFEFPDYYIHGTNAPHTVGSAASHGCLRMRESEVEELAELLQKAGDADRGEEWFRRVRASATEKVEVRLPAPISVTIRR